MGELDDVLKALADEREQSLRQIADDLGVDWDEIKAELTRDFLRPALLAAGFDGEVAEQYEVTWVREDGFRPGLFAQEGIEYGRCAVGYDCPPWPSDDDA